MAHEIARRLVHASGAIVPLSWVFDVLTWPQVRVLLVAGSLLALVLEFVRIVIGVEWVVFDALTREYEQDNLAGYALYVIGGSIAGLLFRPEIAVPAMLMLTIADPVSGLLGSDELRTVKPPHILATMFLVSLGLAWSFLPTVAAVAAALAATLADGVKPVVASYVIDDNLSIPIVASGAAWVAMAVV
ncbi:MAG TPA: dolichol kinase [Natrialbaceae archaeon]|nr:dolichol kinase [Natrialbaceae archaeon]